MEPSPVRGTESMLPTILGFSTAALDQQEGRGRQVENSPLLNGPPHFALEKNAILIRLVFFKDLLN